MLIGNRLSSLRSPGRAAGRLLRRPGGGRQGSRGGCDEPRERLRNGRAFLLSPRRFWIVKTQKM